MAKHSSHILELARRGAEIRYHELKAEIASLMQSFPHLRTSRARGVRAAASEESGRRRRKWRMSPAARKATSLRMKKYWADRRKAKKA